MGKVKALWDTTYPAANPPPGTAKALMPLFHRLPEDSALHFLGEYLRITPSQYLNFGKFAATAGGVDPPTKTLTNGYHPMTSADKQDLILQEAIRQRDAKKLLHA